TIKADEQRARGRNVVVGDATDTDFWAKIRIGNTIELIVLAMPSHHSNLVAAHQIRNVGIKCSVVAIAQFQDDVAELAEFGITSFNMYSEAGSGLARHALQVLGAQPATA
ncbi:MAG: potassium transporter Kef, partial [Betaproteobacteria bacterium]|nr:potassium transporter Kef [Betaproteobacteria bacterium]